MRACLILCAGKAGRGAHAVNIIHIHAVYNIIRACVAAFAVALSEMNKNGIK